MARAHLLRVALAAAALAATALAVSARPAAAASCATLDPFAPAWAAAESAALGGLHVAAAAEDVDTGCRYHFGAVDGFPTASTVKAEILGAVLLSYQDAGLTALDAPTAALVAAMVDESDNTATQVLYDGLGGAAALQAYGQRLGLAATENVGHSWGGDVTTPDDQLHLLRTLLVGGGALERSWVDVARQYLAAVDPSQAWGISAGAPAGTTVWLKNGWLFNDGTMWGEAGTWRVNSIGGVLLPDGRIELLAVYGDTWPLESDGMSAAEAIAAHATSVLAAPRRDGTVVQLPAATGTAAYAPATPTRLLDTRTSSTPLPAGGEVTVDVARGGPVPEAVALTVTAAGAVADGYVTVYADGAARPKASDLNPQAGRAVPDLVVAPVGADGRVRLYASTATDLVVDLLGTWAPVSGPVTAGRFVAAGPVRLLDTRDGQGAVAPGGTRTVRVAGVAGVAADASAVVVTVTATDVARAGFWTAWATGTPRPATSVLNDRPGDTVANTAIVPAGADGSISLFSDGGGDAVVDLVGWFTGAADAGATSGELVVLPSPTRLADSRFGGGGLERLAAASTSTVRAGGLDSAAAVVVALTTTNPGGEGYLTAYPAGGRLPGTSTTNPSPDLGTWASAAVVGLTSGAFATYASTSTDLVVDAWAWFTR